MKKVLKSLEKFRDNSRLTLKVRTRMHKVQLAPPTASVDLHDLREYDSAQLKELLDRPGLTNALKFVRAQYLIATSSSVFERTSSDNNNLTT